MSSSIINEIKKVIKKSHTMSGGKLPSRALRFISDPRNNIVELAIEASQKTGDATWVILAKERCGLKGVVSFEKIAKACHENHNLINASFGDPLRPSWDDIQPDQMYIKYARYNNIRKLIINPCTPPWVLHEEWVKQAKQFISWHPDFKAFGELPEKQKKKTEIFHAMALSLIPLMSDREKREVSSVYYQ